MGHKTFIGGVHPYDGKELSKDSPIKEVLPKGDMVYPVSQHIGAPAKPVVAVGDTVLKGQMIAEAGGFVSSPIYSSVSGKVKAIEKRRVAVGDMSRSRRCGSSRGWSISTCRTSNTAMTGWPRSSPSRRTMPRRLPPPSGRCTARWALR